MIKEDTSHQSLTSMACMSHTEAHPYVPPHQNVHTDRYNSTRERERGGGALALAVQSESIFLTSPRSCLLYSNWTFNSHPWSHKGIEKTPPLKCCFYKTQCLAQGFCLLIQMPVLKAKFHSAKTNKSTMLWAWIHTCVVMDICPLTHVEVWPCWRKYVTRVRLWEFKSSSYFQFVLSVFSCGSGCELSASSSCCHACCLLPHSPPWQTLTCLER